MGVCPLRMPLKGEKLGPELKYRVLKLPAQNPEALLLLMQKHGTFRTNFVAITL